MSKFPEISSLLAHKAPMILIDKLIDATALTVQCQVTIDPSDLFFDKTLDGVPSWVGIEFMAQTIAVWSGYHSWVMGKESSVGLLLGSRRYISECEFFTQQQVLDIHAEQIMESEGMAAFSCRIECNGKMLASSQLNVFVPSQYKLDEMLKRKDND